MNPAILKPIVKGLFVPITIWMFIGCTHTHTPSVSKPVSIDPALEEPSPVADFYVHKVRWSGETLSVITQWYTGTYKNWQTVARANPDLNPELILYGDDILIPTDLLKTNEPMPREFLRTSSRKTKSPPSHRMEPAIEPIEIELFRPQGTEQATTESDETELFVPQGTEQPTVGSDEIELFGPQGTGQLKSDSDEIELFGPQDTNQPTAESDEIELVGPQVTEQLISESDEIELFER